MAPPAKKSKTVHAAPALAPASKPSAALGGDDLEDNLLLDDSYLSPAGDDADVSIDVRDGDEAEYLSQDEDGAAPATSSTGDHKKKRTADESGAGSAPSSKKAKKDKAKGKKKAKLEELGLTNAAGQQGGEVQRDETAILPVEVLADRIAEKQKKALPNLTGLELDEMRISQSMIHDTSSVATRDSLLAFMKEAFPVACNTLAKMPKATGSPRVIVLAGAALRVADLCRDVKSFKTKTKDGLIDVGKLFAKHFKLAEHAEYLQKTHVGIAVGTPNRIEKLLNETDSLKLTHLSHLILDTSHLDAKNRSLFDLPDARGDLFKLLGCSKVMERLREGKMKVVLF